MFLTIAFGVLTVLCPTIRFSFSIWDVVHTEISVCLIDEKFSKVVGYCATMAVVYGISSDIKFVTFISLRKNENKNIPAISQSPLI